MAADILTIDPSLNGFDVHKNNAYGGDVRFDMEPRRSIQEKMDLVAAELESTNLEPTDDIKQSINPELSIKSQPSKGWELDVRGLVPAHKWLQLYGLKRARLDMAQILPQIGFKHSDEYDTTLKKPICSRYGLNLFQRYFHKNGKTFNVACTKDKLYQIETRLTQAICLYKRRLDWLTSESRRVFGVVEEKSICIVIDVRTLSPQQFDQYRAALERVLREQVSQLAKFNLVRASEDLAAYSTHCVPVSGDSIEAAIEWVWNLDRTSTVSATATCEAIMKALADTNTEALYLYTEGSSCDGAREIMKEKLTGARIPVHVVSYNCADPSTITFLKDMTQITGGRFHAYAVVMEMDSYEGLPLNPNTNQANIILRKKTYGGVPPGAGMRNDVLKMFEELEQARNNLSQIQALLREMPDKVAATDPVTDRSAPEKEAQDETYMSSREWLDRHGLKKKKLGFYDILSGVAFKHQDGVVDIKVAPGEMDLQTDALVKQKLVNAKYCSKFPHVRWKDGQVVHVQVSPEIHRGYEKRMHLAMEAVQQRIDWLQQGSRELFGTVIEEQIYILIDTSASMHPHIQFVKDKLFILMQEQLRHKQKFNLIAFNSRAYLWKDRLVEVNEKNLQSAWQWIKNLSCVGSTNSMAALKHALSDPSTQAVYLLSDGRPDQQPKAILSQVMLHPSIPIHSISFNCADKEANEFLCQLSRETGGRFHYYSENGFELDGPLAWESEDVRLLRQELELGYKNLDKVAQLRDECAMLAWKKDHDKKPSKDMISERSASAQPPLDTRALYREPLERPMSAPGVRFSPSASYSSSPRPSTAHGFRSSTSSRSKISIGSRPMSARSSPRSRPQSARFSSRPPKIADLISSCSSPNIAGHTRTSILRTLSTSGQFDKPEWLLPETRDLFDKQWQQQQQLEQDEKRKKSKHSKKNKKMTNSKTMSSKKWLSVHGLVAKKLTIFDALAPTFIPHKSKYVPILNKHVEAKVFDDVLPFGHVSSGKKHMNIVNPQAVNLDAYVNKVEDAVAKYSRRLNRIVWQGLPEKEREELDSDKPLSFLDNKLKLMKALDQSGWPVSERDVVMLENEIKQGESFIQQARDLKEAASNRGKTLMEDAQKFDDEASVASAGSNKSFEGMGDALEANSARGEKSGKLTHNRVKRTLDMLRGQRVIGRNEVDGFYYPGFVIRCPDTRHALVEYEEIGQQTVPTRFVIPTSGAIARPGIRIGDYVLARVINQDTGLECYVPGIVQMTPARFEDQAKFYTIIMYTAQQAHFLRSHLMKISKMRHTFLVRYISEITKKEDDSLKSGTENKILEKNKQSGERHRKAHFEKSLEIDSKRSSEAASTIGSTHRSQTQHMSKGRRKVKRHDRRHARSSHKSYTDMSSDRSSDRNSDRSHDKSKHRSSDKSNDRSHDRSSVSNHDRSSDRSSDRENDRSSDKSHDKSNDSNHDRSSDRSHDRGSGRSSDRNHDKSNDRSSDRSRNRKHGQVKNRRSKKRSGVKSHDRGQEVTGRGSGMSTHPNGNENNHSSSGERSNMSGVIKNRSVNSDHSARSRSRSSSGSRSRSSSHSRSRSPSPADGSKSGEDTSRSKQEYRLQRWQRQLDRKQQHQKKEQQKLQKKAKKLARLKQQLKESKGTDTENLLKTILQELDKNRDARTPKDGGTPAVPARTEDWVAHQNGETPASATEPQELVLPRLLELRQTLPRLTAGEEVLARWSDEGWYYRGLVRQECGDDSYIVEDSVGDLEKIWREDIITDNEDANNVLQSKDAVVALHPSYNFSYAPGVVLDVSADLSTSVRFYDNEQAVVPREEVYRINEDKFEADVKYIVDSEEQWVGQAVVARNDITGSFQLGAVRERVGNGREYVVEWSDGSLQNQTASCIFGAFTKRHPLTVGDRVLGVSNPQTLTYLPGWVTGMNGDCLAVKFCDGSQSTQLQPLQCFWLSQDYYDMAVTSYRSKNQGTLGNGRISDSD